MTKPFLFDLVDTLYHRVMDHAPNYLKDRSMGSAFVLGYVGNYFLIDLVQGFSKLVMPEFFDQDVLPILEKICIGATVAAPVIYSFIKPKELEKVVREHPTYTSGMIGAGLGAIHSTLENLPDLL